jgi:hypothetical protein
MRPQKQNKPRPLDVAPEEKSSNAYRFYHHYQQAKEATREAARICTMLKSS